MIYTCNDCGKISKTSNCTCKQISINDGQITGEVLGNNEIVLIKNGLVIGRIPIGNSASFNYLDAFGNTIPG